MGVRCIDRGGFSALLLILRVSSSSPSAELVSSSISLIHPSFLSPPIMDADQLIHVCLIRGVHCARHHRSV